jgi:hypothetical protein
MDPVYHNSHSVTNFFDTKIEWDSTARVLRIASFSGRVRGYDFSFAEESVYSPTLGASPLTVVIYVARDPSTDQVELFVDERNPAEVTLSPKDAGLENLITLVWADWRGGETDPFSFNAARTILQEETDGRG